MATHGDDAHDGSSEQGAVKTLRRIQVIVRAMIQHAPGPIIVVIGHGLYRGQSVHWLANDTMPNSPITFAPAGITSHPRMRSPPVTFDGCINDNYCPGGTFFQLSAGADWQGGATNVVMMGLHLTNYTQGAVFAGNRGAGGVISHNRIESCHFERMGNMFNRSLCPCCSAIDTVYTQYNVYLGNTFSDIIGINLTDAFNPVPRWHPGLPGYFGTHMHVWYLAHNSSFNSIINNTIRNTFGDPVRFRDGSSRNQIIGNILSKTGSESAYEDWFCDADVSTRCQKHVECPSWLNNFSGNVLDGNFACLPLTAACYCQPSNTTHCHPPVVAAARVINSHNTQTEQPCSLRWSTVAATAAATATTRMTSWPPRLGTAAVSSAGHRRLFTPYTPIPCARPAGTPCTPAGAVGREGGGEWRGQAGHKCP